MCARARACVGGCVRVQIWLISWVIFKFYVFKSSELVALSSHISFAWDPYGMVNLWLLPLFVDSCLGPVTGCCMFAVHNDKDWS